MQSFYCDFCGERLRDQLENESHSESCLAHELNLDFHAPFLRCPCDKVFCNGPNADELLKKHQLYDCRNRGSSNATFFDDWLPVNTHPEWFDGILPEEFLRCPCGMVFRNGPDANGLLENHKLNHCANRGAYRAAVVNPVPEPDESSHDDNESNIPIGPDHQVVIPCLQKFLRIQNIDNILTVDGIVTPMPLTDIQRMTEIQREIQIATTHPERCRPDSPSPERKPARKRPRSGAGAGAAAVAVVVPVAAPVTTTSGRTVKPVEYFKPY